MRRTAAALLLLALVLSAAAAAAAQPSKSKPRTKPLSPAQLRAADGLKSPLESLVSAEQAFARMSAAKNTRDAFVANLAEDCVMFRPLPVNGYDLYVSRKPTAAKLVWGPVYAEIAGSGDLGVTTGPWEFTPPPGTPNAETAYGQFFSIWKCAAGKPWKVALDFGISHTRPDYGVGEIPLEVGPDHRFVPRRAGGAAGDELEQLDGEFSRMSHELNPGRAVVAWTTDDLRYLAEGSEPRLAEVARNAMTFMPASATFHPLGSGIAGTADLGYTYGVREDSSDVPGKAPDSTAYVHVWRRLDEGGWKISLAVDQPIKR